MHKSIKRFGMEGVINDDSDFFRLRQQFERHIIIEMRDLGYVPVLDIGPFWSTVYDKDKESYYFTLSIHGYRVGRKAACTIEGITGGGKMIPRNIPTNKSSK